MIRDWQKARGPVRTAAAATRIGKEIVSRLEQLDIDQIEALVERSSKDQGHLQRGYCVSHGHISKDP
ncbi:hypothetical protein D3C84_421990 [compost metagenome]